MKTNFFTILYKYILTFTKTHNAEIILSVPLIYEGSNKILSSVGDRVISSTLCINRGGDCPTTWCFERHGIKCRSNIWKRFLPGVQEFLFNQKINPSPLLPDLFNSIRRYCYSVEIMFTISILLKVNIMNDNSNISLMSKNFPFLDILDFHKKLSSCNMQITNSNWVVH